MPLAMEGTRVLSPLERDAVKLVFKDAIDPWDISLTVVESIPWEGHGLQDINPRIGNQFRPLSSIPQQEIIDLLKQKPTIEQQLPPKPLPQDIKPPLERVASTYDGNGKIRISRSAFPHTDALNINSTRADTKVFKPANIHYLSTFIYQCTRYWQWVYDQRRTPIRNSGSAYHFTTSQLIKDNFPGLVAERHASAAQVYFVLAWQVRHAPFTMIGKQRKFADIDLTSGPPDNEHSVGPVDRYDEIVRIKRAIGRPIVTYEVTTNLRDNFSKFIYHLRNAGTRKRLVCAKAMQAAQIHPTSPFYDPL